MLKKLVYFFVVLLITFYSLHSNVPIINAATWWDTNWSYRKTITFNNSAQNENLTNFPVLVKLTSSNFDFSKAQSSGTDIRFVDGDDSTPLSYEIEKWDRTNQQAWVWVKVPQIDASSSTDYVYMYYGNSTVGDGQNSAGVWSNGYGLVQHLKEVSGTTVADSTANNNTGTKVTSSASALTVGGLKSTTAGQIDGAQNFDGSTDLIKANDSGSMDPTGAVTVSVWIKPASTVQNNFAGIVVKRFADVDPFNSYSFDTDGSSPHHYNFAITNGTVGSGAHTTTTSIISTNWTHLVGTYDGSKIRVYVNGLFETSVDKTGDIGYSSAFFRIGAAFEFTGVNQHFNGLIDEVQISNTARSANWIAAQFKSENDTFNSFGNEQFPAAGVVGFNQLGKSLSASNNISDQPNGLKRLSGHMSSQNSSYNVTNVECSPNGGGFFSAVATDGSFNSPEEDYYCDFNPTSNSWSGNGYSVRVRGSISNNIVIDNILYFTPFSINSPLDNSTSSTAFPTFDFSVIKQPDVLQTTLDHYQVQVKKGGVNSVALWTTLIDNIPTKGILDNMRNVTVDNTNFHAVYDKTDASQIKVYAKPTSLNSILSPGTYAFKIVAQDKSGHATESNIKTITIPGTPTVIASSPAFPLAILNISGYGNPHLSSLDPNLVTIPTYHLSSLNPIFYGIAFASSNISLSLTEGTNTKTYTTIANNQSRFGINIPKGDLIAGKSYSAILSATQAPNYAQLSFNLIVP